MPFNTYPGQTVTLIYTRSNGESQQYTGIVMKPTGRNANSPNLFVMTDKGPRQFVPERVECFVQ